MIRGKEKRRSWAWLRDQRRRHLSARLQYGKLNFRDTREVSIILRHRDIGVTGRQRHGRWRSEGRGDVGRVMWHKTVFSGMSVTEEGLRSADAEVAGPGPSGPSHSPNFFLLNVFSEPSHASS